MTKEIKGNLIGVNRCRWVSERVESLSRGERETAMEEIEKEKTEDRKGNKPKHIVKLRVR